MSSLARLVDTTWNLNRLKKATVRFEHRSLDIRDRPGIFALFKEYRFDAILHCAAQPSHDKAKEIPLVDFEVNALGTANILEALRQFTPDARMVFLSTNKVYGDVPNEKALNELAKRYEYANPADWNGIDESCRIDRTTHSVFGASKVAADILAQEYGRYFGLNVGVFRGGCLTGPNHSGVELHGFLSYLVKVALAGEVYTVFGYKGKQVRDNIHSFDVVRAVEEYFRSPRPGEVYNIGGGRENSFSILEVFDRVEEITGKRVRWEYRAESRKGDHICYISDLRKLRSHFPSWTLTYNLERILDEIVQRTGTSRYDSRRLTAMLTIFSTPKPFRGHIGIIQRNALMSWKLLHPDVEVILFGDEEGASEACRELGLRHEPHVERHESGMKYLDHIFRRAQAIARHDYLCYCNCDIILLSDFRDAVKAATAWRKLFLLASQRWDTDVTVPVDFNHIDWACNLHNLSTHTGVRQSRTYVDYFVFPRGL